MTKQEAIEQLKIIKQSLIDCGGCKGAQASLKSIDFAIKAIEAYRNCGDCIHNVPTGHMRGCNADRCEYEQRGEKDDK